MPKPVRSKDNHGNGARRPPKAETTTEQTQPAQLAKDAKAVKRWRLTPADAHEWVSFEDPAEEREWRFDVTFLLSHWGCLYGCGCQGVLTAPAPEMAQGCCSYGAHFTDAIPRLCTGRGSPPNATLRRNSCTIESWLLCRGLPH